MAPEQVTALASACDAFEYLARAAGGTAEVRAHDRDDAVGVRGRRERRAAALIAEGGGRIVAAHFGTYDYTAACSITAAHQHMLHPVCDFAKSVMQVALAGTGIWLSDGATNVMPIGSRESSTARGACTRDTCAIRCHRLLSGMGSAPAQLPSRYAAV
jgi:hypothetical protein